MNPSLSFLVNLIISRHFLDSRCLLIFSDNNDFEYKEVLPWVNVRVINGTFDKKLVFNSFGCQGIVVNTAFPITTLLFMEDAIRHEMDRFNHRRYLFLPTDEAFENILEIFNTTTLDYIADLLVIYPQLDALDEFYKWFGLGTTNYQLLTHRFTGLTNNNEMILLDEFYTENLTFLYDNDLYPDKMSNGEGRVWRIATFSYKPYSVPGSKEGTELELSLNFCNKYNLTPYLLVDEEGEWGEIYDNWTGYGILGNVMYDKGDVGLAALYTWAHEYGYLDLSKPVVRTGITCIAPAPTLAAGWLVPLFSFTYEMWIAVAVSFMLCILTLFFLDYYRVAMNSKLPKNVSKKRKKKGKILQKSIFHTAAIFLIQSVASDTDVKDRVKMSMYGCMFLFSLLIASSYSSGLASGMTVPRYVGAIKTVQDLVDSEIQWGATSIAWIMSIMDAPEPNYVTLVQRFLKADADVLRTRNNERFAFSVERLPAGYFAIGEYVTEEGVADLRLMTQDLYWEQCVLMTKKSSIWMPALDDFILTLAQTGIPSVWEFRVATTHLNPKIQRAVKYSSTHGEDETGPVVLKLEHVEGAFGLWFVGITSGILSFVFETFKKFKRNKTKDLSGYHFD